MIPQYSYTQSFHSMDPLNEKKISENKNEEKDKKKESQNENEKTEKEKKIIEEQLKLILEKLENKNDSKEPGFLTKKNDQPENNNESSTFNKNENLKETKFLQIEENSVNLIFIY